MSVMLTGDLNPDEGPIGSIDTAGFRSEMTTTRRNYGSVCEIEEEGERSSELFEINNANGVSMPSIKEELEPEGNLFSFDFHNNGDDVVYVAVGKSNDEYSSMDALVWTLTHAVGPSSSSSSSSSSSTLVFLVHVFPEVRFIPTPLGKIPTSQVNPEQKENHMVQERSKRREFLQKFLDTCSVSKVKVDTILIESDTEAKALLDLIPILNIRKLVLGTNKSSLRKLRLRRGSGTADQVLQNAPEFCEVKIICEGKEVVVDSMSEPPSPRSNVDSPKAPPEETPRTDSFACTCFKPKVMA